MKIANLKIGTRLGIGFGIQLLLLAAAVGLGLFELSRMNQSLLQVTTRNNVIDNATATMRSAQLSVTVAASNVVLLADAGEKAEQARRLKEARAIYDAADASMRGMITRAEAKALLDRIDAGRAETRPLVDKAVGLGLEANSAEGSMVLTREVAPAAARWQAALSDMTAQQAIYTARASAEAADAYADARGLLFIIGGIAMVLGVAIAWRATRSITQPIAQALKVARTVAAGDLTSRIDVTSRDETGALMQALKEMNHSLQEIVGQVRQGTDTIACASTEIASGNLDLSARTEQQASSLEETAASMEELTTTVKQNSDNARQANVLAESASEVAIKGGAVVGRVVETMSSINESSRKIVDIIGVIDGIAFQTNILALNAAVEAARAGEQGRGFAVVATEVRSLAQRSAGAAKEIKQLIDDSVAKVALGSSLVNEAGGTMEEVVASVRRVTDMMGEITAAGREQETGIAQINQAVIEMDAVTQQNAALVEEAAAAAESLQDQAGRLSEAVSVFKLDSVAATPVTGAAKVTALRPAARPAAVRAAAPRQRKLVANGAPQDSDWEAF